MEDRLSKWITAGLALYKAQPRMLELVFYDPSQSGWPSARLAGTFIDLEKQWIPDEWAGGIVRWAGSTFPILSNTATELTVEGDPSGMEPIDVLPYQIVPPAVPGLTELLTTEKFTVLTAFAQVPTSMPAFSIRLERDQQADTYIGESLQQYVSEGVEFDVRSQAIQGSYLISIWSVNREATIWLYSWLLNYALQSIPQFTTWGLYDVSMSGSDLDPALQYLAERTYTRHLLLTATRQERAVTTRAPVWVEDVCVKIVAAYASLAGSVPQPLP